MSDKLKADSVGLWGLIFIAMGSLAPIAIFAGAITGAASTALGETTLSFVVAMVAALFAANTIFQYSKRVIGAQGYYGYVRDGVGRHAAVYTAYLYVFYAVFNISFLILIYAWAFSGSINLILGTSLPNFAGVLFVLVVTLLSFFVVYRGLRPSAVSLSILGIIQIAIVVVVSAIFIGKVPSPSLTPFMIQKDPGVTGLFLGVVTGSYLAYAGYGTVVSLGEEAKAPKKTIGRAVVAVILIATAYYVLGSYSTTSLWGLNNMANFASSGYPGAILAKEYIGVGVAALIILLYNFVMFSPIVAFLNSVSRVMYAMGRDGLLPTRFKSLHPKLSTPTYSLWVVLGLVAATTIILGGVFYALYGFSNGLFDAWLFAATATTISTLIVHGVTNVSLGFSARKWADRNLFYHYVAPAISTLVIIVVLYYSAVGLPYPIYIAPILVLVYSIILIAAVYAKRSGIPKLGGGV
ncbi:MAG: APC family permease [Thermoprotei archaeon]